jgi:hypothetical protein
MVKWWINTLGCYSNEENPPLFALDDASMTGGIRKIPETMGLCKTPNQWDYMKFRSSVSIHHIYIIYNYIYLYIYILLYLCNYLIQSYPLKSCLIFPSGSSHFFPSQTPRPRNRFIDPHESMLVDGVATGCPEHKDIKNLSVRTKLENQATSHQTKRFWHCGNSSQFVVRLILCLWYWVIGNIVCWYCHVISYKSMLFKSYSCSCYLPSGNLT